MNETIVEIKFKRDPERLTNLLIAVEEYMKKEDKFLVVKEFGDKTVCRFKTDHNQDEVLEVLSNIVNG